MTPVPEGAGADFDLASALVSDTGDAVIVADLTGRVILWNDAAEAMFGRSHQEALGATLDFMIPERLRERHWEGFRQVVASGVTQYGGRTLAVPALRADGTRISIEFTVALLKDEAGGLRGIGAIIRDVTARWEEQRASSRRTAELEAELANLRR